METSSDHQTEKEPVRRKKFTKKRGTPRKGKELTEEQREKARAAAKKSRWLSILTRPDFIPNERKRSAASRKTIDQLTFAEAELRRKKQRQSARRRKGMPEYDSSADEETRLARDKRRARCRKKVEAAIVGYHQRGYDGKAIIKLLSYQGVNICYAYLKNHIFRRLGLSRRRHNRADAQTLREAVIEATRDGSTADASSNALTQILRVQHGLNTVRADVLEAQRQVDPESVQERRRGQLHRRVYASEGSNYLWHVDGYDKLAPYGLPIHGCIDGFSRFLLWLEVAPTNKKPEQTCKFFLDAVAVYGLPHSIRVDAGTENKNIKWAQRFLSGPLRRLTPLPPILVGSSNHNERIERFWGCLRRQKINWWINHFKTMVTAGHIVPWDDVDRKVAYFVYNHLIRAELNSMIMWHNDHLIRKQSNPAIVRGKPFLMYHFPEDFGRRECKLYPSEMEVLMAQDRMAAPVRLDEQFHEALTELVRQDNLIYPPPTVDAADHMYISLRTEMVALLE